VATPFNEISTLPANSNGARTVLEEHLDINNGALAAFLEVLVQAAFARGGVITTGTVTADAATMQVTGRAGITNDRTATLVCSDQTVDCSSVTDGNKARVYLEAEFGEYMQVNFTDADTSEALSHTLGVALGRLAVIEGDSVSYPALPPGSVPVARITMTGGSVAIDAEENHPPATGVNAGATGSRPADPVTGESYFDTTLGYPVWWDGSDWVDATGTSA